MPIWKRDETIQKGRFLIKKRLGEGGFGITYLAEEAATGKQVVIKTLNANRQSAENFKQIQVSFMNEALKLRGLRHPQIVRVEEFIQEDDLWGMVMEYIEGMELSDLVLDLGQLTEAEALGYIDQIAQALDYVHQQGILHRDVKPHNIMLRTGNQEVILIDFGLARDFIDDKTQRMTNFRTDGYAPPEQYQEDGHFAAYTDVYALAATTYHLLTGQRPMPANFRQSYNTDLEPKTYNPAISDRVNQAIVLGLSMDANQRPQNMTEFRELLGLVTKSVNQEPILDAEAYFERGKVKSESGDQQGALADYDKAIELDPNFAKPYNGRGNVKSELGDRQGALADYNKAIQLDPHFVKSYNSRGVFKSELGDRQGALADYNKAIQLDPHFTYAYNGRGNVKSELGDKKGALADYNKAIKLDPHFTYAYNGRGNVKSELGDRQGALADYSKAIQLDPHFTYAYANRGYVKYKLGDIEGALSDHNQAIEIDPNYTEGNQGNIKYKLGNIEEALTDYNKAIKIDHDLANTYCRFGCNKIELGDIKGALADYNKAIQLDPNVLYAYANRGNIKYKLGDIKGALADYNKAIQLDPNLTYAYKGRGNVKSELGDREGALVDYTKAAKLYQEQGQTEEYERILSIIKNLKDSIEISVKPKNSDRPWWRIGI